MKDTVRNNDSAILFSFLVFILGFLWVLVISYKYNVSVSANVSPFLAQEFSRISFERIFLNNFWVVMLLSFGGVLTFGGLSFLNLLFNGANLGTIFYDAMISADMPLFLLLIFPHGIFEIPGLIIAGAAGFKIPYELLRFALSKKEEIITEEDAKEFFKLVSISILLIFIAAVIESTLTLWIAEKIAQEGNSWTLFPFLSCLNTSGGIS